MKIAAWGEKKTEEWWLANRPGVVFILFPLMLILIWTMALRTFIEVKK